ncbi:hypothetical protein F2P81_011820 [Scophthalmus maximus]|uniref:Zinc-binding protein A33-like n=1 Tax=Scophthalmus maximus TaxID=52904 RepID=A0A6A4SWN9_SCOMX|nr:hypothetical protein F2P81_011820 [Scophthalmus maximus]
MAESDFYTEHLTCGLCLSIFTDPVTLLCGHSFCRRCITGAVNTRGRCPQCGTAVAPGQTCLPTNHILKSLGEKAREAGRKATQRGHESAEVAGLCPQHQERLKLFCVTDQQLACIICRDGENHQGHKFKPIKEVAASLRKKLEAFVKRIADDIDATERLVNTQTEEIGKTKDKVQQLTTQICRQFEEMHQFLRKREDEITNDLKHKEEEMSETLNAMETALSESRVLQAKVASVLDITDSDKFVKSWTEDNAMGTSERSFRPRANELQAVRRSSLSLGPYDSHLQFFMWKEMLQLIKPRAEPLSLKRGSAGITVSDDGRSLFCTPKSKPPQSDPYLVFDAFKGFDPTVRTPSYGSTRGFGQTWHSVTNRAFSVNEFSSGQHYWEIDVGHRRYWELGIKDNFLKYDGRKYSTRCLSVVTELSFAGRPRKIGIYLNCTSKKLSFYDADNMTHIQTVSPGTLSSPLSAYFNIRCRTPDPNPMTVCWY